MMRTNGRSQALFGGLIWGDQAVRYIFMDEAGTSEHEPVSVVVGVIANADEHIMSAEGLVHEILEGVPPSLKDGFVFHAKQVFGDKKYQEEGWSFADRLSMLQMMMSVPFKIGMSISVGASWRGAVDHPDMGGKISPAQWDHIVAFCHCIIRADQGIRQYAGPREVATVVAEDIPEMRKFLKGLPRYIRENPFYLPKEHLRETISDKEAGYSKQSGEVRVSRIRNSVHFVGKAEDPLVQVADACAYGIRRYFAGEKFGSEFVQAIFGTPDALRDFASPGGGGCRWRINSPEPLGCAR